MENDGAFHDDGPSMKDRGGVAPAGAPCTAAAGTCSSALTIVGIGGSLVLSRDRFPHVVLGVVP